MAIRNRVRLPYPAVGQRRAVRARRPTYSQFVMALVAGGGFWHPMRNTSGLISTNAAYLSGVGAELLTNGAFNASLTPWIEIESAPDREVTWQSPGFARLVSNVAGTLGIRQQVLSTGKTYQLQCNVLAMSGSNKGLMRIGSTAAQLTLNGTGIKTGTFVHQNPADLSFYLLFDTVQTGSYDVDDASCREAGDLDGVIAGTTSLAQPGLRGVNEAFLFDGATSLITIINRASIQGLTAFTLWALFKPSSAGEGNAGTLFSKSGEFELRFNSASRDLIATVNYSGTNAQRVTSTALSANDWHTVGMRIDNSGKTPEIFVDGVEASYASTTVGVGARVSNTNNLIVGNNAAVSQTIAGLLDEVLLATRSLSSGELRLLHILSGLAA